jgi:hypothetical protein
LRTVQVVVASKIDPPEAALTQTADDPVAPDPGWIAVRGPTHTHEEGLGVIGLGEALGLVHGQDPGEGGYPSSSGIITARTGTRQ